MKRLQNNFFSQIVFITGFILLFAACNARPKGVLNQSDMINVLTDLHKLDGSMAAKGIPYDQFDKKNEYYISVLSQYGITQAEFDSSLVWYSRNPKNFDKIYDKVIDRLTDLQNDINKGKYHPVDSVELAKIRYNIWNKRIKYVLTKDSARTHLAFEIQDQNFMLGDVYTLKFLQRIAPEDSSTNQLIRFQINYVNGRVRGVIKKAYNDSLTRRFTLRISSIHPSKIKSISGELLGSSAYKGKLNVMVDSISLIRSYNSLKQDSLLKVLQAADPAHYPVMALPINNELLQPKQKNIRVLILKK
ncbi:MAG TPA: DUF4296 domain-containing protein [Paludibacter sp.]|nr:DUF4296 domain-containing protein [Paludibacter sp.]